MVTGRLTGKTALVTGGTSGIGLATARLFQSEGALTAVTGRRAEDLARTQEELGESALVLHSDAGKLADIETLLAQVGETFGKLDVLFLNAAIAKAIPFETMSESDFDETLAVNLKGVFFTVQRALPLLSGNASIIVTTSISNRLGSPNAIAYAASKAGLRSMVQGLALALVGSGIRVNAISPGPIDTPMFGQMGLSEEALQSRLQAIREKSPISRFGRPDEIASVALFLASDESSYIVGEEIVVDGGMSLL